MNLTDRYKKQNDEAMFRHFYKANEFQLIQRDERRDVTNVLFKARIGASVFASCFDLESKQVVNMAKSCKFPIRTQDYDYFLTFGSDQEALYFLRMLFDHIKTAESKVMVSKFLKRYREKERSFYYVKWLKGY